MPSSGCNSSRKSESPKMMILMIGLWEYCLVNSYTTLPELGIENEIMLFPLLKFINNIQDKKSQCCSSGDISNRTITVELYGVS